MSQNTSQNDAFAGHHIILGRTADGMSKLTASDDDYVHVISQGRIAFEHALDNALETHTWPQILELMVNNEREHHD